MNGPDSTHLSYSFFAGLGKAAEQFGTSGSSELKGQASISLKRKRKLVPLLMLRVCGGCQLRLVDASVYPNRVA